MSAPAGSNLAIARGLEAAAATLRLASRPLGAHEVDDVIQAHVETAISTMPDEARTWFLATIPGGQTPRLRY